MRMKGISSVAGAVALFALAGVGACAVESDKGEDAANGIAEPQCPPKTTDRAFLPCTEKFLAHAGIATPLVPYAGQALPSDGPLLDIFAEDRSIRSVDGVLETPFEILSGTPEKPMKMGSKPYELVSYNGPFRLGGIITSYNGIFPSPTLVTQPGDTIRLKISDKRIPDAVQQASELSFDPTDPIPQQSNIHSHGLLVSPTGQSDNVYRSFLPGNDYLTEIKIPATHDQGVNWYHPHFHASTAAQVYGGLAGIIQIGNVVGLKHRSEYGGLTQRTMLLHGMNLAESERHPGKYVIAPVGTGTSPHFIDPTPGVPQGTPSSAPDYAPSYFINGQINPIIEMKPGETQVWTFANVSPFAAYSLAILKIDDDGKIEKSAPLFRSTLISQDGNDHFTPVDAYFIKQRDLNKDTYVAPGERLTWAITAPTEPGDYYLVNVRDSAYTEEASNLPPMLTFEPPESYVPSVIMGTVRIEGEASTKPRPVADSKYDHIEIDKEPDVTRNIAYDFDEFHGIGRINFGTFPNNAIAQSFSGDNERWVVGVYSQVAHPFHIHQGQFVVEQIEYFEDQALTRPRTDLPENPVINDVPRDMDTFALPGRSKVTLRLNASDYVGKFVMHCHLLLHEDQGMMVTVRVLPPRKDSLTAMGAGGGSPPEVTLARADTGEHAATFKAYDDGYKGGVQADVGPLLAGTYEPYVVTITTSGEPLVRVFDRAKLDTPVLEFSPFDGEGDGGSITLGDIDGDSVQEIVIGSGKGTAPAVKVYNVTVADDGSLEASVLYDLPVFDDGYAASGIRVASADIDGDNWDDIVVTNGPGAQNRLMALSGQELQRGNKDAAVIVDATDPIPGDDGLNVTADNLAGGFFRYPPITLVGQNPPAPSPYRALIAVTPAASTEDPIVTLFRYTGAGGHQHGSHGDGSPLEIIQEFTPFPGETAPAEGLALTTGLTLVADKDNPLSALIAATGNDRQSVSYFTVSGDIETKPWATPPDAAASQAAP